MQHRPLDAAVRASLLQPFFSFYIRVIYKRSGQKIQGFVTLMLFFVMQVTNYPRFYTPTVTPHPCLSKKNLPVPCKKDSISFNTLNRDHRHYPSVCTLYIPNTSDISSTRAIGMGPSKQEFPSLGNISREDRDI
jgi:hypothetical protein